MQFRLKVELTFKIVNIKPIYPLRIALFSLAQLLYNNGQSIRMYVWQSELIKIRFLKGCKREIIFLQAILNFFDKIFND